MATVKKVMKSESHKMRELSRLGRCVTGSNILLGLLDDSKNLMLVSDILEAYLPSVSMAT